MQHVSPTDGVPGDHRHDGLGTAPDLDVQIRDVEATDRGAARGTLRIVRGFEVPGVPPHLLIPRQRRTPPYLPR